jgi:hypothetical protein
MDEEYTGNEICKTGYICPKSGLWFCEDHPSVEVYVSKGREFPKCHHVAGHNATWILEEK